MRDGDLRMSFEIAHRTGRTIHELRNGGPGREAMSVKEYQQWVALITIIEPRERDEKKE